MTRSAGPRPRGCQGREPLLPPWLGPLVQSASALRGTRSAEAAVCPPVRLTRMREQVSAPGQALRCSRQESGLGSGGETGPWLREPQRLARGSARELGGSPSGLPGSLEEGQRNLLAARGRVGIGVWTRRWHLGREEGGPGLSWPGAFSVVSPWGGRAELRGGFLEREPP